MKTVRLTINNEIKEIQIREKDERSFNEKMIRDRVEYDYNKNGWNLPCEWED